MRKPDDRQIMVAMAQLYNSLKIMTKERATNIQVLLWMASQLSEESKKDLKRSKEFTPVIRDMIE